MLSIKLFLLFATSILLCNIIDLTSAKNWAVILVGLNYYRYTYGFEAMAYKQYNDLVKNGIDPENIILISPDTAAYHPYNPMPGLIAYAYDKGEFSADYPANQYENIEVDYKGYDLSMDQFFQIFNGTTTNLTDVGSGRVIKSGLNDNIFVYIHTLGYEGYFLLNNRHILYTDKFIPFLEELSEKKYFKNMLIFMHASYSGSMFDNYLDPNERIIVYSLGGRYNEFTMCHPNKYLGDAFTSSCQGFEHYSYMDKAIAKNGAKETLLDLYSGSGLTSKDPEAVHNLYGDFSLARRPIKEFYGPKMKNSKPVTPAEISKLKKEAEDQRKTGKSIIEMLTEKETTQQERDRIEKSMNKVISESIKNTKIPRDVVNERVQHLPLKKYDCYRNALETMRSKCLTEKSEFVFLKYSSQLAKLCSLNVPKDKIVSAINSAC